VSVKRSNPDPLKLRTLKVKWKVLFDTLSHIVPCTECKEHIVQYIASNPYASINSEEEFSTWFYLMHEDVNKRLGKPSFDKALLLETYNQENLRTVYYKYDKLMEEVIREGEASLLAWGKMKTVFLFLFSYYNI
jgi:hypothetical protein